MNDNPRRFTSYEDGVKVVRVYDSPAPLGSPRFGEKIQFKMVCERLDVMTKVERDSFGKDNSKFEYRHLLSAETLQNLEKVEQKA